MPPKTDDTVEKDETPITELTKLEATVVSGVTSPANGTPFLVLKAREDSGGVAKGESEQIEELLTKGICGDDDCPACIQVLEGVPGELAIKAKLRAKERNAIPTDQFADPEDRKLPVHDEPHTRNAISRFNQTNFRSSSVRRKAARRIKSAARRFGIQVGSEANVNKELAEGWGEIEKATVKPVGPGVTPDALKTPQQKGKINRKGRVPQTANSGKDRPMTKTCPTCSGKGANEGGKAGIACRTCGGSGIVVVDEGKVTTNHAPPSVRHSTRGVMKEDCDDDDNDDGVVIVDDDGPAEKQKAKEKNTWIAGNNAGPGSPEWEDFDSASLDSVARGLACAARAVECIQKRERIEAVNGTTSDWRDAADLANAGDAILTALSFVSRLAYTEAVESKGAVKSIRPEVSEALRAARIRLTSLIGDSDTILIDQGEGRMPTSLTKDQFDGLLRKAAKKGSKAAIAAMQDDDVKKKPKKAPAFAQADAKKSKTSNNEGEVAEAAIRAKGRRKISAQLGGVPKSGSGKVRKQKNKEISSLKKSVDSLATTVQKMASRPRSGGPVLDGQFRGQFPATDRSGKVAKSDEDKEIQALTKELEETLNRPGPENAAKADYLGQQLTLKRLYRQHVQEGLGDSA